MRFKIQDISRIAVLGALITVGEALETFLPSLQDGGTLKLSEVVATISVVLMLLKTKDKKYTFKIMTMAIIVAIIISYATGLYRYAIGSPIILALDYVIPILSPIIIAFAGSKNNKMIILLTPLAATIAFISHVISGVLVWDTPLFGSIIYNSWYCFLTAIVQVICVVALLRYHKSYE